MILKDTLKAAQPTPKVATQTTVGALTGLVTWLLVTTYWKTGLPPELAAALPFIISVVWGFAGGWLTKEDPGLVNLITTAPALPLEEQLRRQQK